MQSAAPSPVNVQPQVNTQAVVPNQSSVSSSTQMIRQAINGQPVPRVMPQASVSASVNPVVSTPPGTNPGTV